MSELVFVLVPSALIALSLLVYCAAWIAAVPSPAATRPSTSAREAAYKAEVERALDALEEARRSGDLAKLRLTLEDAMYAWLAYSACAPDPDVRESRRRVLLMLAGWHASLADAPCR